MTPAVPAALTGAPVQPDRDQARSWARDELVKSEYQAERPGPLELFIGWLREKLDQLPAPDGVNVGLGVTIAVLLLLAVIGYVLWTSGGVHRRVRVRRGEVFDTTQRTADQHRRASEAAESAGDLATALLERFRAIARSLSERALVELTPGLTADELATRAAGRLPALGPEFQAAARAFDDVRYGDRPATVEAVRRMRALDEQALRTVPAAPGDRRPLTTGFEVPR